MITNGEIVSRISNGLKLLNKDGRLSRRYILHIAEKNAELLISHKLRDRSLFRESNIYSTIDCFDMESKDVFTCGIVEFKSCNKLMKSKNKINNLIYSRYGSSLKEVTSIDYMSDFKPSTLAQFRRDKQRLNKYDKTKKFYIKDGYLYIPDEDIRKVSLELIVVNTFKLNELDSNRSLNCKSAWEYEFKCPDKILDTAIQKTIQELSLTMQLPEDENPNLDSNIKSRA